MHSHIEYTVVINGKPQGPYQFHQLKELGIQGDTFVRKPGMDDYKEAHELPELRELFGFVYQQSAPQYFASFDQRLLAMAIDLFFIVLVYAFLLLLSFIFIEGQAVRISAALSGIPLIPIAKLIYGSITEASVQQGGIGKRLMNIKVTDLNGSRIGLANAFGRNIAKALSAAPFFFGYLYSFLNKKQQCFHDIIAKTLVTKERLL